MFGCDFFYCAISQELTKFLVAEAGGRNGATEGPFMVSATWRFKPLLQAEGINTGEESISGCTP